MKPRPSSSTKSGIVGDFSLHTPLLLDLTDLVQQNEVPFQPIKVAGKDADELHTYVGSGQGFCSALEKIEGWSCRSVSWPLGLSTMTQLADTIKTQSCAFLHCGLDETCGREVVSKAYQLARMQRRANRHFLVVATGAWSDRLRPILDHELIEFVRVHDFSLVSNAPSLLLIDALTSEDGRL